MPYNLNIQLLPQLLQLAISLLPRHSPRLQVLVNQHYSDMPSQLPHHILVRSQAVLPAEKPYAKQWPRLFVLHFLAFFIGIGL